MLSDSVNQIFIVNSCDPSVKVASGSARNRSKLYPDCVKTLVNGVSTSIDEIVYEQVGEPATLIATLSVVLNM